MYPKKTMRFNQQNDQQNNIRQHIRRPEKSPLAVQVPGSELLDQSHDDTGHNSAEYGVQAANDDHRKYDDAEA